ncbi:MAG: MerR family DNA-binding transcriptional regulator, partial [Candidatus Levyibacteriota bacterium]
MKKSAHISDSTLSVQEVAKLLRVSTKTIRRYDKSGILVPTRTDGNHRRYSREQVSAFLTVRDQNLSNHYSSDPRPTLRPSRDSEGNIFIRKTKGNNKHSKAWFAAGALLLLFFVAYVFTNQTNSFRSNTQKETLSYQQQSRSVLGEATSSGIFSSSAGVVLDNISNTIKVLSSRIFSLFDPNSRPEDILAVNLNVEGNTILGNSAIDTLTIYPSTITFVKGDNVLDIQGKGSQALTLLNSTSPGTASLNLSDGDLLLGGITRIENDGTANFGSLTASSFAVENILATGVLKTSGNITFQSSSPQILIADGEALSITDGTNTLLKLTDAGISGSLEVSGDLKVSGNTTLSGKLNDNTFTSTKLVFAGASPSITTGTQETAIALDAGTTGAVNIASSSTGDVNIAGGSSSTGCTITNVNGNLNCAGNITASGNLIVNGGNFTTNQTTFNLLNTTSTTLNIGGAATAISLGASTGTTTIN